MVFWGEKNMIRLSLRITTTVAIASLCGAGFLSCKNGAAGRSMETGVNPSDVTEISSASDVVIPGDGKITIDAYRKDKDEDDFKLAVSSTAITGPNLALASTPLKLAETYKCTVTIRKVDRVSFQMVDVLTSAATACEPLPAPAAGYNFKISGVEADSLYLATLHVVPDSTPNSATTVKAVLPPISDECRGDQARFTMMADALTNGAANLILELVKIADTTSSAPNADAQTTLLHLNLPDLLHFAAGSKREMDDAASDYASIFSDIYTDVIMSSSSFDVAVCESTTGILLKPGSIAENLTIYTQSTAIQAWNAMIGLADAVSQTIDQIYTISIEIPDNVDFPFLRSVHKAYLTVAHNATAANVVDEYEAIDKTETGFNLETSPAPSLAPNY
ncbi:MAG: hypothetical protein EBU49_06940 [Proteobacteria bacterium]|nr:hypothetical protein [Pseudomonadota bacterium]